LGYREWDIEEDSRVASTAMTGTIIEDGCATAKIID